jgi:hypothetical protein
MRFAAIVKMVHWATFTTLIVAHARRSRERDGQPAAGRGAVAIF